FLLGLSILPFFYNLWYTANDGKKVEVDDPWGDGRGRVWGTALPPPRPQMMLVLCAHATEPLLMTRRQ
ncbi:hypothetical protein ACFXI6_51640, partial [Streptomyces mirabilis]|uniref:hypothetical protein n=1 Tax=Streptomyces mirabilis TaxID=68239 RepID=UPI00368961C4